VIIQFSKRSKKDYQSIITYLNQEFGEFVTIEFETKFKQFIVLLSKFPQIGQLEISEKGIYGFQFSYQSKVFYRIKQNQIVILTIFDVRQNDKKKRLDGL